MMELIEVRVFPVHSSSVRTMPDGWTFKVSTIQALNGIDRGALQEPGLPFIPVDWCTRLVLIDGSLPGRTNQRIPGGGPRSRAKALSNLIHLFRASGCPSSGLLAFLPFFLSFFTYLWLRSYTRHTMGNFNMSFNPSRAIRDSLFCIRVEWEFPVMEWRV